MDKDNVLNGFQVFDDLISGGNKDNDNINDLATGELTDEELEALRSQDNDDNTDDDTDIDDIIDDDDDVVDSKPKDEPVQQKRKPGRPKRLNQSKQSNQIIKMTEHLKESSYHRSLIRQLTNQVGMTSKMTKDRLQLKI